MIPGRTIHYIILYQIRVKLLELWLFLMLMDTKLLKDRGYALLIFIPSPIGMLLGAYHSVLLNIDIWYMFSFIEV